MTKKSFFIIIFVVFIASTIISAQTWLPIKRLSWAKTAGEPVIAVDSGNNLHVVWEMNYTPNPLAPTDHEIFYKKSTDSGTTWSAAKRLTWSPGWASNLSLAIDSNDHIHLAWNDNFSGTAQLYYKKSTDGGSSWSALKRLTWLFLGATMPEMAIDSNDHIHLIFVSRSVTPAQEEIFYKKSTDGGTTWTGAKRLTWTLGATLTPKITIDSNDNIHSVWCDNSAGDYELYYKKSTDAGTTWTGVKRITWTLIDSDDPAIVSYSNNFIHIIWSQNLPYSGADIFYKRSTDGGITWLGPTRLTWSPGRLIYPAVSVDLNHKINLVWIDWLKKELFYKRSTNGGQNWEGAQRLTWSGSVGTSPYITTDLLNNIHIVFPDVKSGKLHIYYKKGAYTIKSLR